MLTQTFRITVEDVETVYPYQETVANNVDDLCASCLDELRGAYNPRKVGKQVTRQRDSPDRSVTENECYKKGCGAEQ